MAREDSAGRSITNTGYVDLTGVTDPEELAAIEQITNVGVVLVPEELAGAIAKVAIRNVGQVVKVPAGRRVSVRSGIVQLSGTVLENRDGDPTDVLVLVGQIVITGVPQRVGYELIVSGILVVPREAEDVISRATTQFAGQMFAYTGANVRVFTSKVTLDREFLELLPEGTALLMMDDATFEPDVTKELLQSKVTDILHMGALHVPKHLRAVVQVLASTSFGDLIVQSAGGDMDGQG
ncbi:MAG: hypothetical protein GX161_05290 [Firmicutes bacterium]|jgi:hypothetical protein|nr:hypothetical protein [Bacillota bacterium]